MVTDFYSYNDGFKIFMQLRLFDQINSRFVLKNDLDIRKSIEDVIFVRPKFFKEDFGSILLVLWNLLNSETRRPRRKEPVCLQLDFFTDSVYYLSQGKGIQVSHGQNSKLCCQCVGSHGHQDTPLA